MSLDAQPVGRTCFVRLRPATAKSTVIEVVELDDRLVHEADMVRVGPKCKWVVAGRRYLVRSSLGVPVGDLTLLPEVACLAELPA